VTAGHFFYIPSILLLGIVLGWILGSRAAAEAFAARQRQESRKAQGSRPRSGTDS
jgi:hypothetical protein